MNHLSGGKPKTIDELKEYCASNGFTSEKTRFFIGENYKDPRAFGIYEDEASGEFIVYKNKDDGNRAIRYRGTDEAFAVGELYDRLQKEIANQKQHYYAGDIPRRSISDFGKKLIYGKRAVKKNPYLNMEISEICSDNAGKRFSRKFSRFRKKSAKKTWKSVLYLLFLIFLFYCMSKISSHSESSRSYGNDNYYYNNYENNSWGSDSWGSDSWGSDSWDSGYTDWGSDW